MRKIISTWGLILLMLLTMVGTAAAQDGVEVTPTSVPTSESAETTLYQHPMVQILSAYFGRVKEATLLASAPSVTPTVDPSATATENPTETTETTEVLVMGPEEFAEQIATLHNGGMGFGVLVKIFAMAEASAADCAKVAAPVAGADVDPNQPTCTTVTVDELVTKFQSGTGMGQLFKLFDGKPALLGVGHVKKALQNLPQEVEASLVATPVPAVSGSDLKLQNQKSNNGKSRQTMKIRTPNSRRPAK